MFEKLYYMKRAILMLENLRFGSSFNQELFANFRELFPTPTSLVDCEKQIETYCETFVKHYIPHDVYSMWDCGDYTAYTDNQHHRKFWNEIENDVATQYFFEVLCNLIGVATEEDEDKLFMLELYDFNDASLYFDSEEDANVFINRYGIDTCVGFERRHCLDAFSECWSI